MYPLNFIHPYLYTIFHSNTGICFMNQGPIYCYITTELKIEVMYYLSVRQTAIKNDQTFTDVKTWRHQTD